MASTIQTKEELLKLLLTHRKDIEKHGIKKLGVFGSFSRNQAKRTSDVDFLVEFKPGKKNYDNFFQLAELLEHLCQRKIELLTPESLSPHLATSIHNEVEYVLGSN